MFENFIQKQKALVLKNMGMRIFITIPFMEEETEPISNTPHWCPGPFLLL